MTNQEKLQNYLLGSGDKKGYLKSDLSNGKVIILSGKWGSGKTHFWQNIISTKELKKELKDNEQSYSYISLYGKTSIEEIENDIFGQIYFNAINGDNIVTKTASTFTKYSKRYGGLLPSFDLSKLADGLEKEEKDNKQRIALERLNNGGIICFDDFERKSKDIDLNDLFGFITQLTLNFKCKVVIILNDDVFEGKEKTIFSNVKEKSVSKFLYYNPTIDELFKSIYEKHPFSKLEPYNFEKSILEYIKETEVLNARIYNQILDNVFEWFDNKNTEKSLDVLRCLIHVNINFIFYHVTFYRKEKKYFLEEFHDKIKEESNDFNNIQIQSVNLNNPTFDFEFYESLDKYLDYLEDVLNSSERLKNKIPYYKENKKLYIAKFFANFFDIGKDLDDEIFKKINQFIKTGIL